MPQPPSENIVRLSTSYRTSTTDHDPHALNVASCDQLILAATLDRLLAPLERMLLQLAVLVRCSTATLTDPSSEQLVRFHWWFEILLQKALPASSSRCQRRLQGNLTVMFGTRNCQGPSARKHGACNKGVSAKRGRGRGRGRVQPAVEGAPDTTCRRGGEGLLGKTSLTHRGRVSIASSGPHMRQ